MSVHQLKDGRWIVKYPDPEKASGSRREYFGRGAAAETAARARDRNLDLKRTKPRENDHTGPTFNDLSLEYLINRRLPRRSQAVTVSILKSAINPAIGQVPAIRLTHSDMGRYVRNRLRTVKASTVRRELAIVQAVMNASVAMRPPLIPMNPLKGFPSPVADDDIISPPTMAEISAILEHANERLRRFIIIAFYTGLRPGAVELLSLRWEAVSWETETIRVVSARKGGVKLRDVPIHPDFLKELKLWRAEDTKRGQSGFMIYLGKKGRPVVRVDWSWEQAKKKAGITRRLRLYDLRHFFVTSAIESGADYKTLSDIVGSNPETLRRHYQHVSNAARVSLIERMPSLVSGR